jgi:hypothetical protein
MIEKPGHSTSWRTYNKTTLDELAAFATWLRQQQASTETLQVGFDLVDR